MLNSVVLFFLILSSLYLFRITFNFVVNFFSNEPKEMKFNVYELLIIYVSISYIITYIIEK